MGSQAPAIVVLAPMFGAVVSFIVGRWNRNFSFPIVFAGLLLSLWGSISSLMQVIATSQPVDYFMAGWQPPRGIGLRVDGLSGIVLVVVCVVALLVALYGWKRVTEETPEKVPTYWALFSLLCTGLLGIVITADAFNVFVLLEVSSLTSYALIALGSSKRGTLASFQYIIIGTMGASFYLLGVGYLYLKTGSLNMGDIHDIIGGRDMNSGNLHDSGAIKVAFLFMTIGVWIKMAFFPLHGWLANAYTYSPSTTACILAPLMTKVSVYVMLRVMLGVFGAEYVYEYLNWSNVIVWLSVVAIVAGSFLALAQTQLKKMLCFLIVAEVGYMAGGAWLANTEGLVGTAYHIVSDALMTVCLFFGASLFWRKFRTHDIDSLRSAFRTMPLAMTGFALAGLSMIGIPPTCGFFSKWYLIRGGIEAGQYGYVIALLFSSLVNAILFIRIFEKAYYPEDIDAVDSAKRASEKDDAPIWGLIPLYIGVVLIFLVGLFNGPIVDVLRKTISYTP